MYKLVRHVQYLSLLAIVLATLAVPVQAEIANDIQDQLDPIEEIYGNPSVDERTLPETIAEFIRIALSVIGIIFLALIVYAGFLWMTSAGNEDRIDKAKQIMSAAVIGTIIVLAAYIITIFVFDVLLEATGND